MAPDTPPAPTPRRSAGDAASGGLRIGLAGWSYPDWHGTFYPSRGDRERGSDFSELRYAARIFDCLEINSTFYRIPEPRVAARWARDVQDIEGFSFTAKLHRSLTHEDKSRDELRALCRRFREGLEPLAEAGRLGCVLLQFPWYFEDSPRSRERIRAIAGELELCPLVAELRHASFLGRDDDGALPFLGRLGVNFANIDLPRSRTSPPLTCINTGPIGYFRLHGRNHAAWFDRRADRDAKYDYLYSPRELEELFPLMARLAERTEVTYAITNNHFRGQAPANALQLMQLSGRRLPPPPESLQAEFPFLGGEERGGAP